MPNESCFGYVYRITNNINGKTYIGKHKAKLNEKWLDYLGSGKLITLAIQKYGKSNFTKELLKHADNDEDLSIYEIEEIQKEIASGKAEYNLYFGDPQEISWSSISDLENYPILDWYFEKGMSTREIALEVRCSQPTVIAYFAKHRDSDERFSKVKQRSSLIPRKRSPETLEKMRESRVPFPKIECSICENLFAENVFKVHFEVCTKRLLIEPKKCKVCQDIISIRATYCRKHFKSQKENVRNGKIQSAASALAAHTRWHVKRNKSKEDCIHCEYE